MALSTGAQDIALKLIAENKFVDANTLAERTGQTLNAAAQTLFKLKQKGVITTGPGKSLDSRGYKTMAQYVTPDKLRKKEYMRAYYEKRKQGGTTRGSRVRESLAQNDAIAEAATILKANEWPIDQFLAWVDFTKGIMNNG